MVNSSWKPGKPATLIPLGNIDLATQWVPYARRALSQLAQQGDFRRKMIVPAPGIVIHLETRGGIPRIIIEAGGSFWWWAYLNGPPGGLPVNERFATIVAADVPGTIRQPDTPVSVAQLYGAREIFNGPMWLVINTPHVVKLKNMLGVAVYEGHNDLSLDEFYLRLGTVLDNGQPAQPQMFYDLVVPLPDADPGDPPPQVVRGDGPSAHPFFFGSEWAVLMRKSGVAPFVDVPIWVRGRYPTADDPTVELERRDDLVLDYDGAMTAGLPGPNPGAGDRIRRIAADLNLWQGSGSFDPENPPDPETPADMDFYYVVLAETRTRIPDIPGEPSPLYQQAPVLIRRSILDPETDVMATAWLLDEYVQTENSPTIFSVQEYQGKVWLIFGRYVRRFLPPAVELDRDWYFDQYVVDKTTGELLYTQLDCGVRVWTVTDSGIFGYTMPEVTFSDYSDYNGQQTAKMAHVKWQLGKYQFDENEPMKLVPVLDANNDPVVLLDFVSNIPAFLKDSSGTLIGYTKLDVVTDLLNHLIFRSA